MEYRMTEDQQMIKDMARDFADQFLRPIAAELDENEHFPVELLPQIAEAGLLGIPISDEYEGAGLGTLEYVMAVEEIAKVCASTAVTISGHTSLCAAPIEKFGTPEQKAKYLADLASGRKLGAFALTEPAAGTDAAMQKTVAEDKGDYYLMNGSKVFITNGSYADIYVVFAMTDKSQGTRGITAFILEKGMEGFKFGTKE